MREVRAGLVCDFDASCDFDRRIHTSESHEASISHVISSGGGGPDTIPPLHHPDPVGQVRWPAARSCTHDTGAKDGLSVENLTAAVDDGRVAAPREVDPQVGVPPHVVALDHRTRLLVDDHRTSLFHLVPDELIDQLDGLA